MWCKENDDDDNDSNLPKTIDVQPKELHTDWKTDKFQPSAIHQLTRETRWLLFVPTIGVYRSGEGHTQFPPSPLQHLPRPEGNNSFSVCASPSISRIFACKKLTNLTIWLSVYLSFCSEMIHFIIHTWPRRSLLKNVQLLPTSLLPPQHSATPPAKRKQKIVSDRNPHQFDTEPGYLSFTCILHPFCSLSTFQCKARCVWKFYNLMNCSSIESNSSWAATACFTIA